MTVLQIIAKLWSHITDLRLYARGKSSKTLAEIEKDIAITECYCSVYMEQEGCCDEDYSRTGTALKFEKYNMRW